MTSSDLKEILAVVQNGGIILNPTDTIWGIGCDATNEKAVDKIMELKNRPSTKSLVCLISHDAMLNQFLEEVPELAWDLFDQADSPLTLVLPGAKGLAKNVVASDGSIAFRMIKNGPLHQLIYNLRKPLVSTSANLSGQPSPTSFAEVSELIKNGVDCIADIDTGFMTGKASSIIKLELNGQIQIIRK
jgi:L-threonylcarbamoyladenylate synthase